MGILKVKSTNPKLSYIIEKNPQTIKDKGIPWEKKLRKGKVYGAFSEGEDEFTLLFVDSPTEVSYTIKGKSEFEYLDKTRYSSPYLPISLITNCLSSASKSRHAEDADGFKAEVSTTLYVPRASSFKALLHHYNLAGIVEVGEEPLSIHIPSYTKLTVSAPTLYAALNTVMVICLLQTIEDEDLYIEKGREAIDKYVAALNASQAPYFVRYLFASRVIQDESTFEAVRPLLEQEGTSLKFGNTRHQRYQAIREHLKLGQTLVDIGCGELYFERRLCSKYLKIVAFDKDEEQTKKNQSWVEHHKVDNIKLASQEVTPTFIAENKDIFNGSDVLLTEVVEHMELSDAKSLVYSLLDTDFKTMVITTPNKEFNKNFGFEPDQTRNSDHKWEISLNEFEQEFRPLAEAHGISSHFYGIGDLVHGDYVSSMAVFVKD